MTAVWLAMVVAAGTPARGPELPGVAGTPAQGPELPGVLADPDSPKAEYLRQTSRQLFLLNAWGDACLIGSGLAFLAARSVFAQGFELQTAVWGAGSAAVALSGLYQLKHHPVADGPPEAFADTWARLSHDARQERLLNAGIDGALLAAALLAWRLLRPARWRGMAAGIALQCGFLGVLNLLCSLAFS